MGTRRKKSQRRRGAIGTGATSESASATATSNRDVASAPADAAEATKWSSAMSSSITDENFETDPEAGLSPDEQGSPRLQARSSTMRADAPAFTFSGARQVSTNPWSPASTDNIFGTPPSQQTLRFRSADPTQYDLSAAAASSFLSPSQSPRRASQPEAFHALCARFVSTVELGLQYHSNACEQGFLGTLPAHVLMADRSSDD